jgi:hypothetical protein
MFYADSISGPLTFSNRGSEMKKLIILIVAMLLIGLFASTCPAQQLKTQMMPSTKQKLDLVPTDSIDMGDYVAVFYDIYDKSGEKKQAKQLSIYRDNKIAATVSTAYITLYNFAQDKKNAKPVYRKDVNKDGIDEIIIIGRTNGFDCCYHAGMHGLTPDKFTDITRFELKQTDNLFFKDINKDSIPEIFFKDANFANWHARLVDSPLPELIWEWHNGDYRLANYKYADYLAKDLKKLDFAKLQAAIKTWTENYNPASEAQKYPPPMFWGYMLDYIYADQAAKADSIFNEYWPKEIPGKDEFYAEFKQHLEDGIYWKGLQESKY